MSTYKFKSIQTVPPAKQLVDIALSRTQRKTPTVVHPGFKITRIRSFYMRKVKYLQSTFGEKLEKILESFPKIDDIHPFYADLCNVLYDRDHYKLALGQVNATKKIIDNVAKDYVKMMKFADSLYKCKTLKRAAMGRMCTCAKKLTGSLAYLEEVRQHMGRLPSINPATRTLILTGYPNVGKSSFMNVITNANVDVQPYAFTTKSLFVGHLDHNYVRWQVIDTPGILDHPLEDRNTIEMTAITALAHLPAAVLFFVDVSEMCGCPLATQVALFHSIKPLFRNRPLLVILNKTDLRKLSELSPEEKALIDSMKDADATETVEFFETSCATREGIDSARCRACDLLLEKRVEAKVKRGKVDNIKNRLHVVGSAPPANRPPSIPESILRKRTDEDVDMGGDKMVTERDRMLELGGAGVYSSDHWRRAMLEDASWKYDKVPEIMDGQNVADFVDPDIEKKLADLDREEELLIKEAALRDDEDVLAAWSEKKTLLEAGKRKRRQIMLVNKLKKSRNGHPIVRSTCRKTETNSFAGLRSRAKSVGDEGSVATLRSLSERARSQSLLRGLPSEAAGAVVEKTRRKLMRRREKHGKKGEGDRHIPDWKPKHLFSGKRGIGKTDRR